MTTRSRFVPVLGLLAVALGALGLFLALPSLLGMAAGTPTEVGSVLVDAARHPLQLAIPGSQTPLIGRSVHFQRVTVTEEGADRARAVSTLDFEGSLGSTRVSSLGRETTRFARHPTGWEVDGSLAPTLAGVVAALVARQLALQTSNEAALGALHAPGGRQQALAEPALRTLLAHPTRNTSIQAWYVRSESGEVTVTEEDGPPPQLHRLKLVPSAAASLEFVFVGSLL